MIIKASKKDIPTVQNIAKNSWEFAYADILKQEQIDYMLDLMYNKASLEKHFENPNYHYYLIVENKNFIGFIGLEYHHQPKTTKLHRIYFLKEAQGKGYGKTTEDFIKSETEKSGDQKIILTVNKKNSARKFYESQGFKVYDEAIFDIGNNYVMDDYLMELILNP